MNSTPTPLVSQARKQGSAGLRPHDRCGLLVLHGVCVDARRRQSWTGWQGAAARRATADNEHDRVRSGYALIHRVGLAPVSVGSWATRARPHERRKGNGSSSTASEEKRGSGPFLI
jgi:hypothetical protein